MKVFRIWEVYDKEGIWRGYYLDCEKEIAEHWANVNDGSVKEAVAYCLV